MSLYLVPVRQRYVKRFIRLHHRTHQVPPAGWICGAGVATEDRTLVGVYMVGRPSGPGLDDGLTAEITRVATDETRNASSMLYGAAVRAALAQGYQRVITYNEKGESGASLRAAGFRVVAERKARKGWDCMARPRDNSRYRSVDRTLWEAG